MYCKVCGKKLNDGDKFCSACGAKVEEPDLLSGLGLSKDGEKPKDRSFHVTGMNWDLSGYPSEDKHTGDADFNWSSVMEKNRKSAAKDTDFDVPQITEEELFERLQVENPPKEKEPVDFDWGLGSTTRIERHRASDADAVEPKQRELHADFVAPVFAEREETTPDEADVKQKKASAEVSETSVAAAESAAVAAGLSDMTEDEKELSPRKRIDRFYTFNKKNEEFQALLDQEYERLWRRLKEQQEAEAEIAAKEKKLHGAQEVKTPAETAAAQNTEDAAEPAGNASPGDLAGGADEAAEAESAPIQDTVKEPAPAEESAETHADIKEENTDAEAPAENTGAETEPASVIQAEPAGAVTESAEMQAAQNGTAVNAEAVKAEAQKADAAHAQNTENAAGNLGKVPVPAEEPAEKNADIKEENTDADAHAENTGAATATVPLIQAETTGAAAESAKKQAADAHGTMNKKDAAEKPVKKKETVRPDAVASAAGIATPPAAEGSDTEALTEEVIGTGGKLHYADIFNDDEEEEPAHGKRAKVIALDVLIILLLIGTLITGILAFAPNSGAAKAIRSGFHTVQSVFTGKPQTPVEKPGDNVEESLVAAAIAKIDGGKMAHIEAIEEDSALVFKDAYGVNATEFTDMEWQADDTASLYSEKIVKTTVEYFSKLTDRMNAGSEDVLSLIDPDSALYGQVKAISKGEKETVINKLQIGEIKGSGSDYYCLVRVLDKAGGENRTEIFVVRLKATDSGMPVKQVEDITA